MKKMPENQEKPKKSKKVFYVAFAIILAAVFFAAISNDITAFMFASYSPKAFVENQTLVTDENALFTYEINRYPTSVQISNVTEKNITLGFALDPGSLKFGIVPTGGNEGKRFLTLQNTATEPSKIKILAYGNISPMIQFSENDFLLQKESPVPLEITLKTENMTALGNYSGEIDIIVKKPKYGFAAKLL